MTLVDGLRHDFTQAFRAIVRSPGFTALIVLSLAIGIGANTAVFSAVHSLLLRQLPFADADRLVSIGPDRGTSYMEMLDWQAGTRSWEALGLYSTADYPYDLTGTDRPLRVWGVVGSPSFFEVLQASAAHGRTFVTSDPPLGGERTVVVSHGLWQRRFGGDPDLVGSAITLNDNPYRVVGIMPPDFQFPRRTIDVWVPLTVELPLSGTEDGRGIHMWEGFGRLHPGVSLATAQSELDAVAKRLDELYPEDSDGTWPLVPLREALGAGVRRPLLVLTGAVGCVLLILCVNLANLFLVRALARRREVAVRMALGAGRGRLLRQLLLESGVLALAGGAAGVAISVWVVSALSQIEQLQIVPGGVRLDVPVLAFAVVLSLATGLLFGIVPALEATRSDAGPALRESSRTVAGGGRERLRSALVVVEIALALVLLAGAGLLTRTLWNLTREDPGFDPRGLLTFQIFLPESRYPDVPEQAAFFENLLERLGGLPGVQTVAAGGDLPLVEDWYAPHNLAVEDFPVAPEEEPDIAHRPATPGYFATLGIPLVRGREFTAADRPGAPLVAIVNEALVSRFWPDGTDPIGRRIRWARLEGEPQWMTIVGVVRNVKQLGPAGDEEPAVHTPHAQSAFPWRRLLTVAMRTTLDPLTFIPAVEREVWRIDPGLPMTQAATMEELLGRSVQGSRAQALLLGGFAAAALVLAALGIYGVTSYAVTRRTREIGVRIALGAQLGQVAAMVLGSGARLAFIGIVIGVVGAIAVTRVLAGLLYGVSPGDPLTLTAVAILLAGVALLASWLPARRAARMDPAGVLRAE